MGLWMADSQSHTAMVSGASWRYRVRLLGDPRLSEGGVSYREGDGRKLLAWAAVQRAIAAEVGEPQGVRTIVFDLVGALEGADCSVCRLDAEPGQDAVALARVIAEGIGPERASASIKSLVTDGLPNRWYPDLDAFEESIREEIAGG